MSSYSVSCWDKSIYLETAYLAAFRDWAGFFGSAALAEPLVAEQTDVDLREQRSAVARAGQESADLVFDLFTAAGVTGASAGLDRGQAA